MSRQAQNAFMNGKVKKAIRRLAKHKEGSTGGFSGKTVRGGDGMFKSTGCKKGKR